MDNRLCERTKMRESAIKITIMIALITIIAGCTNINHKKLAETYKLDLQYYDNAVKFESLNMSKEAVASCNMTTMLKSECFSSIAQEMMSKGIKPDKEICGEIKAEKINMTMKAFELSYPEIDNQLRKELKQKMNPSKERRNTINKIREDCLK